MMIAVLFCVWEFGVFADYTLTAAAALVSSLGVFVACLRMGPAMAEKAPMYALIAALACGFMGSVIFRVIHPKK